MRDKSSPAEPKGLRWRRVRLGWPVERVPLMVEVVHPRKLTALEWVVLRVVDAFGGDVPDLNEVAEELGIADPVFLSDTLRDVVRLRALAPREGDDPTDLSGLEFTSTGRELYQRGQIEGDPAEHGLDLFFDALTDEARAEPKGLQHQADNPFPAHALPPEARSAVGLDRAREIIGRLHAELLRGDGEVRSARLRPNAWPNVLWAPVEVDVVLTAEGHLLPMSPGLSPAAQQVLRDSELDDTIAPRGGVTAEWEPVARCRSDLTHEAWRSLASRTLSHGEGDAEMLGLLRGAAEEVLVHAGWYGRPGVAERVDALVRAGARVAVLGHPETAVARLQELPKPGLLTFVASEKPLPAAVVVDGRAGLMVDNVLLRVGDQPDSVELVGILTRQACAQVRQQFMSSIESTLPVGLWRRSSPPPALTAVQNVDASATAVLAEADVQERIARLALLGRAEDLRTCTSSVCQRAPGPERVVALSRVARLAVRFVPSLGDDAAYAEAAAAWRSLVKQLPSHRELVNLVALIAPPGTKPEDLVQSALPHLKRAQSDGLAETAEELVGLQDVIDGKWGAGTCARVKAFIDFRDRLLGRDGRDALAPRLAAARQLLVQSDLRAWCRNALDRLPEPETVAEFESWTGDAGLLATEVSDDVAHIAEHHLHSLLARDSLSASDLLRSAARLLPSPALLAAVLPAGRPLRDVAPALRALADAGVPVDGSTLRRTFEQFLPPPSVLPSRAASDGVVYDLESVANNNAVLGEIARAWARRCADTLPRPESLDALPWWWSELAVLRPFLSDLQARASQPVGRFAAVVRAARDGGDAEWDGIESAWQELGAPISALLELLAEPAERARPSGAGGGKKSKKKRRKAR